MDCAPGCSTVEELIVRAARQLGDYGADADQQFVTWSRVTLIDYLNEGLRQLLAVRPDAFATTETLYLKPGALQTLAPEYASFLELEPTTSGAPGSTNAADHRFSQALRGKRALPMAAPGAYRVESAARGQNPNQFTVSPPVPPGQEPAIQARVTRVPAKHRADRTDAGLGVAATFEAALVEWVLYRAWGSDAELAGSATMSAAHYKAFHNLLGIQLKRESAFNSGYWLGQQGTGDPRFAQKL